MPEVLPREERLDRRAEFSQAPRRRSHDVAGGPTTAVERRHLEAAGVGVTIEHEAPIAALDPVGQLAVERDRLVEGRPEAEIDQVRSIVVEHPADRVSERAPLDVGAEEIDVVVEVAQELDEVAVVGEGAPAEIVALDPLEEGLDARQARLGAVGDREDRRDVLERHLDQVRAHELEEPGIADPPEAAEVAAKETVGFLDHRPPASPGRSRATADAGAW